MARKRKQYAVYLSEEISKSLCKTVPKGKRSRFVEEALINLIRNLKQNYGKNWVEGYYEQEKLMEL